MAKVIIHISGLTDGDREFPKGVPVEATQVLTRMANGKERREGVVAVTWAEAPKAAGPKAEVSPPTEAISPVEPVGMDRKAIMDKLKEKGVKFFPGVKTEVLLAKLKEAGE